MFFHLKNKDGGTILSIPIYSNIFRLSSHYAQAVLCILFVSIWQPFHLNRISAWQIMSWILKSLQNKAAFFLDFWMLSSYCWERDPYVRDILKTAMLLGPCIDHKRKALLHNKLQVERTVMFYSEKDNERKKRSTLKKSEKFKHTIFRIKWSMCSK